MDARVDSALDEMEIANLLVRWGHARDGDHWDILADCFHDEATIHISWISSNAKEFVARSADKVPDRAPGEHTKHAIGGPWIQVAGDRAFSRCHVSLSIRNFLDGYEFDMEVWFRFLDLLEKRDGVWRILKRTAVYEKDRMDAVEPHKVPDSYYEGINLDDYPAACKMLCFRLHKRLRPPVSDIVSVYSDEEKALLAEGAAWIS